LNPGPDSQVKQEPSTLGSLGVHQKQVEIRWSDVDAYQHVNNAVYLTYLEECRDEWLDRALGDVEDSWDFVLARVAIDFRRELRLENDAVLVRCRLERIGTSSVTTREEIRTSTDELAAEAEAVLVARNPATGESRPLRPEERSALERA
jgi:acyl-CoA thioester hydrolase